MRKTDNLTTILGYCHVIWEPQLPGTLWEPRACNGTDIPFLYLRYADYAINYKRKWLFIARSTNSITVIRVRNLREWNYSQQIIFLSFV